MKIVLASASPRRRELIRKIYDLQATVVPSDIVEDIGECEPAEYVKKLAELKACDVYSRTGSRGRRYGGNL